VRKEQRKENCNTKAFVLLRHAPAVDASGLVSVGVQRALQNVQDGSPFTKDDALFVGFHLADFVQNGLFFGVELVSALDRSFWFGLCRFFLFVDLGSRFLG